jgi:hypothetical protein
MGTLALVFLVIAALLSLCGTGKGKMYYIWYIRGVQVIAHLPMLQILVPANVSVFYEMLIPFLQFDILDSQWTTELVMDFDFPEHRNMEDKILDQMRNLGYETHSSILNLGSMWLFAMFYFISLFVFLALLILKRYGTGRCAFKMKFLKNMEKKLIFSSII